MLKTPIKSPKRTTRDQAQQMYWAPASLSFIELRATENSALSYKAHIHEESSLRGKPVLP